MLVSQEVECNHGLFSFTLFSDALLDLQSDSFFRQAAMLCVVYYLILWSLYGWDKLLHIFI